MIEVKSPSASNQFLTANLSLGGAPFNQLHTNPIQLIPNVNGIIVPISIVLHYRSLSILNDYISIGNITPLTLNNLYCQALIYPGIQADQEAYASILVNTGSMNNLMPGEDLILYSSIDLVGINFSIFNITIVYYIL